MLAFFEHFSEAKLVLLLEKMKTKTQIHKNGNATLIELHL